MKIKVSVHLHNVGETRTVEVENGSNKIVDVIKDVAASMGIGIEPGSVIAKNGIVADEKTTIEDGDFVSTSKGSTKSA